MASQEEEVLRALFSDPEPVTMELSKWEAWILFSQLQLALRHPQNTGSPAESARHLALVLIQAVATTPGLQALAEAGWAKSESLGDDE